MEYGRPISTGPSLKMCSVSLKQWACWMLSIIASASVISFSFMPQRLATFLWHFWWTFMPHASHLRPCLASPMAGSRIACRRLGFYNYRLWICVACQFWTSPVEHDFSAIDSWFCALSYSFINTLIVNCLITLSTLVALLVQTPDKLMADRAKRGLWEKGGGELMALDVVDLGLFDGSLVVMQSRGPLSQIHSCPLCPSFLESTLHLLAFDLEVSALTICLSSHCSSYISEPGSRAPLQFWKSGPHSCPSWWPALLYDVCVKMLSQGGYMVGPFSDSTCSLPSTAQWGLTASPWHSRQYPQSWTNQFEEMATRLFPWWTVSMSIQSSELLLSSMQCVVVSRGKRRFANFDGCVEYFLYQFHWFEVPRAVRLLQVGSGSRRSWECWRWHCGALGLGAGREAPARGCSSLTACCLSWLPRRPPHRHRLHLGWYIFLRSCKINWLKSI